MRSIDRTNSLSGRAGMAARIGKDLTGRVAVITGASSGIGAASARLFAEAGARVVVGYNQGADRANAVVESLAGGGHKAIRLPLEDSAEIRKAAAAVREEFGRADILVNSAGFTRMVAHHDLEALTDELIDQVLTANVRGVFATIRAFAPLLREAGDGVIVNISSGADGREDAAHIRSEEHTSELQSRVDLVCR